MLQIIKTLRYVRHEKSWVWRNKIGLRNAGIHKGLERKRISDVVSIAPIHKWDWVNFESIISPDQRIYKKDALPEYEAVKPVSYSIIKSGIIGLTRYLATYWIKDNVRCNAICPGGIENNQPEEFKRKLNKLIPLARMAKKDEYKSTIIWMLSTKTTYLNGAIVSVDGGRTAW